MTKEKFTARLAVYLILLRDEEILLQRRYQTGWRDGNYSLVSGHLEGGETVTEALIREVKEEAGIELVAKDLKVTHVLHRRSGSNETPVEYIDFFLTARAWSGEPKIMEPHKCDDLSWFPLAQLPPNLLPYVRNAIAYSRDGVPFSESGWSGDTL